MASHLIEHTGYVSQETWSSEQSFDIFDNYDDSDTTTDPDIRSGPKEATPISVEDFFCQTCSAVDFQAIRSNICTCYVKRNRARYPNALRSYPAAKL